MRKGSKLILGEMRLPWICTFGKLTEIRKAIWPWHTQQASLTSSILLETGITEVALYIRGETI